MACLLWIISLLVVAAGVTGEVKLSGFIMFLSIGTLVVGAPVALAEAIWFVRKTYPGGKNETHR